MEVEGPFTELRQNELEDTVARADKRLQMQRRGLDTSSRLVSGSEMNGPTSPFKENRVPGGSGLRDYGADVDARPSQRGMFPHMGGWIYVCEFEDCISKWSTSVVPEEQMVILVEMYKLHVEQCHSSKSSADQEKFDKDQASYVEATKVRAIGAHEDNRVDILSPVRFFPKPLRYKYIAELQPANQKPVWDRIDLNHVGIQLADTSIVRKIHNRAYAGAKLEDFSSINLGVNESDKDIMLRPEQNGGMRQTRGSKVITTYSECMGALMNCLTIWQHIHPCDYGTLAIVRFLLNKLHQQNVDKRMSVKGICNFFRAAFKGNADRVLGPEGPRTFQEVVTFFNSMEWDGADTTFGNKVESRKRVLNKQPSGSPSKVSKRDQKSDICWAFISVTRCNRSDGEVCVKKGRELKHCCSKTEADGRVCSSKEHGEAGHVGNE